MKKSTDTGKTTTNADLDAAKMQAEEWRTKYMRVLADYQNLEKRSSERINDVRTFAAEVILSQLLPVLDTFTKVGEHVKDAGFDLAYKELMSVITTQGVERMDVVGKPFDPKEMDCIEVVSGETDMVVTEVLPGYRFRGKVLRVAVVKVGKTELAN